MGSAGRRAGKVSRFSQHGLDAFRCAPGIDRGFHAIEHPVEYVRHDRCRTFGDGPSGTQHGDHRTLLSFAAILSEHHASVLRKSRDTAGRQEMKARGQLRWLVPSDWHAMSALPAHLVEELPLA